MSEASFRGLNPVVLTLPIAYRWSAEKPPRSISTRVIMREMHNEIQNKIAAKVWEITI
jgi:hypothetical protein